MVSPPTPDDSGRKSYINLPRKDKSTPTTEAEKNFGLSQRDFDELLQQLYRGDERLYEKIFLAHFGDCMHYLKVQCKASHNDAYDATMEATALFLERLQSGKVQYGNLRFLFTRIAVQIYFRWVKDIQSPLVYSPIDLGTSTANYEMFFPLLEKVWPKLQLKDRHLLTAFYFEGQSLKQLAEKIGAPAATLRKRKQRGLDRLRQLFLEECKRSGMID